MFEILGDFADWIVGFFVETDLDGVPEPTDAEKCEMAYFSSLAEDAARRGAYGREIVDSHGIQKGDRAFRTNKP